MYFYIKGCKEDKIYYFDGCHHPYDILEMIPNAHYYEKVDATEMCNYLNKNNFFTKISWKVVNEKEYFKDKKRACKYYITSHHIN